MYDYVFRRREQKYILTEAQRLELLRSLEAHMEREQYGQSKVCNIYYDTPDHRLIRHSMERPVYKEKLRLRSYGRAEPGSTVFLEMKKKYKGVVYKRRVSLELEQAVRYMADPEAKLEAGQIGREIDYFKHFYAPLRPAVYLSYDRMAWHLEDLRVTMDWNVRYRMQDMDLSAPAGGELLLENGLYLLEIKTATAMPLWLVEVLNRNQIRKQSFSKYGSAYMRLLRENQIESRGFHYA